MIEKRQTILVVDDVPDDILILEEVLKRDYQVKAVTTGEAALKIAQSGNPPDLILLDIMMPVMDGFEVCRLLKQDSQGALIPVIFLTAKGMPSDEKIGFELGAVDYIRKPVDPEIVRARVKSQLEQKDRLLRSSEVRFRRLFETSKDGILIFDLETGAIVDVNPSLAGLMGVNQEFFLGRRISELDFLRPILSPVQAFPKAREHEYIRPEANPVMTADGRSLHVEIVYNSYKVNSREVMQLTIRDISVLVAAERERDAFSAKLSHYLSTSPTVTYSLQLKDREVQWLWVSENIRALLGYSSDEALGKDWWFRNISAKDRGNTLGAITELSRMETSSREYRFARKDRSMVWLRDEMRLVRQGERMAEIVGTLTDITASKKAEEEIRLKSSALEAAANAVVITSREGTIKWVNPAFEALSGYSKEEVLGKDLRELVNSGIQDPGIYREMWQQILAGKVWKGEFVNRKKNGELYFEEITITPVADSGNAITDFIAVENDITEKRQARETLESALREKTEMLQEIHHRVNNNVQIMISLLNISSKDITDPMLRRRLEDIIRRMHSMSMVHQQFYESGDLSRIDFAVFLLQLVDSLKHDFPGSITSTSVEGGGGKAYLGLEQAIPAGLIVSELLSNSMRSAASLGSRTGKVGVVLRTREGKMEIAIEDDGPGLMPGPDSQHSQSIGMMLIRTLAEQLGGNVEIQEAGGKAAVLSFPVHNAGQASKPKA